MDILLPEYKTLLLLLKKYDVNFMLIGGYAVIYYGYERTTSDMDIWLEPSNQNKEKLVHALTEFGVLQEDLNRLSDIDYSKHQFFFFGKKPRRIDFLNFITGVTYAEAIKEANLFPLKDQKIPIIQYHHLILSKISNNRDKDKADIAELQRIDKYRNK